MRTTRRRRSLLMAAGLLASALSFAACKNSAEGGRDGRSPVQAATNAARAVGSAAQDPCTLLSAPEAEPYVGALALAPFRASDGSDTPDGGGEECVFRGKDGTQLTVLADWRGGGMMGKVLEGIPKGVEMAETAVPEKETGPWDKVKWTAAGALFVYKGDAQIRIDLSAAGGREDDALAMAREIVPRIGHPLSYSRSN